MINVEGPSKTYRVAEKQPGLAGTLRHLKCKANLADAEAQAALARKRLADLR